MKKGIQLSINFLVTIIIGIVLLVLGILILRQFIGGAEEIKEDLDARTEAQLSNLLSAGQQVAVPFNSQTIRRGDGYLFGLGILNILDPTPPATTISFEIKASFSIADAALPPDVEHPDEWLRYNRESFDLRKSEQHSEPVLIQVPKNAQSGTYIFNVEVKNLETN